MTDQATAELAMGGSSPGTPAVASASTARPISAGQLSVAERAKRAAAASLAAGAPAAQAANAARRPVADSDATRQTTTDTPTPAPPSEPGMPEPAAVWKAFFEQWPPSIPTRGIIITRLNEPTPFKGFLLRGAMVLLERTTPDSMGGRFMLLPFAEIANVKLTDPLREGDFKSAGFAGQFAK
ncbi:MAG: hypothetical protein AAF916_12035 [Planctomycetota bacterium]